jgi:hypothetical protein
VPEDEDVPVPVTPPPPGVPVPLTLPLAALGVIEAVTGDAGTEPVPVTDAVREPDGVPLADGVTL